jgi:hypothetical protein
MSKKKKKSNKKKSNKKKNNQSKTLSANTKQLQQNTQSDTEKNQNNNSTFFQKIWRYRKWVPVGFLAFCIPFYVSYWPDNLVISSIVLGATQPFSNPIIVKNVNSYAISDVKVFVSTESDINIANGFGVFKDSKYSNTYKFAEMDAQKGRSIRHNMFMVNGGKVTSISNSEIIIVTSFKTPFIYPNIENDTTKYKGVIKQNGEILYIEE